MRGSSQSESHERLVKAAVLAALLLVAPLVAVQVLLLGGVVLSENGFGRFVPQFQDVDYDGRREIVIGCENDGNTACTWHGTGRFRYGSQ